MTSLVTDRTAAGYNSYFTLQEVEAELAVVRSVHQMSEWDSKSDPEKNAFILMATRDLNEFTFVGSLADDVNAAARQTMRWPRKDATYPDGVAIGEAAIPPALLRYIGERIAELTNVEMSYDEFADVLVPTSDKLGPDVQTSYAAAKRLRRRTLAEWPSARHLRPLELDEVPFTQVIR